MGPKLTHATEHSSTRATDSHLLGKVDSRSLLLQHRSHKAKLGCFQFLSMQTWAKVQQKKKQASFSDNSSHHYLIMSENASPISFIGLHCIYSPLSFTFRPVSIPTSSVGHQHKGSSYLGNNTHVRSAFSSDYRKRARKYITNHNRMSAKKKKKKIDSS